MNRFGCIVFALFLPCVSPADEGDAVSQALSLICDRPEAIGSEAYHQAVQTLNEHFPEERVEAMALPDRALAWMPDSGPCGGPGSPLGIAFLASLAREPAGAPQDQVIHRAWLVVIKHYAHFRQTMPDDFPVIATLEEMARSEKAGTLLAEATALWADRSARKIDPPAARSAHRPAATPSK